jgi:hypothetical protein
MNNLFITADIDWASEAAIEETLDTLKELNVSPTIFSTHRSAKIESSMDELEVGLHPYFGSDSSHGSSIPEVVAHVMALPHNLRAFRCHRYANCNASRQAMMEAGMVISSNVCTDLEVVLPFKDRLGLLEVPIFLEDGGYLWQKHPLELSEQFVKQMSKPGPKVINIHPMHFCINTPHFDYMYQIKQSMSRSAWNNLSRQDLQQLRWKGRGIRDLIIDLIQHGPKTAPLSFLSQGKKQNSGYTERDSKIGIWAASKPRG